MKKVSKKAAKTVVASRKARVTPALAPAVAAPPPEVAAVFTPVLEVLAPLGPVPALFNYLSELEEIATRVGAGTATVGDLSRQQEIGEALTRGLPVPVKVVGKIADHRNGRGRIWSRK